MAISMGAALLGSAIIGGGASVLGGNATNKGIQNAANADERAAAASRDLQERVYSQNNALLSPYNQRGNAAGNQINALLGLGGAQPATTSGPDWNAYLAQNPDVAQGYATADHNQFQTPQQYAQWHYSQYGQNEGRANPVQQQAGVSAADATTAANNAFDLFRNSSGYQFRMDEGNKSLNALNAARGTFDSGAAEKAAIRYGQNYSSGEFGNYMGYLGNQQGVGLSAASAVAGVGQNYANNVTGINQNNAANQGNLALQQGQNTNNMLGGLASSFGVGLGALTKFGQPQNALVSGTPFYNLGFG